jgi:hypothetical protein
VLYRIISGLVMNNLITDIMMHGEEIRKLCRKLVTNSGNRTLAIVQMITPCCRISTHFIPPNFKLPLLAATFFSSSVCN